MPDRPARLDDQDVLDVLARGEMDVIGRLVDASNATLYCGVSLDGVSVHCVYKPVAGERPLWDFPERTLARREAAAYLLCVACGWTVVPPTVLREGPFGPGSVQHWIEAAEAPPPGARGPAAAEPGAGLVDVVPAGAIPDGWLRVIDAEDYDGAAVSLVHADDEDLRTMAVFDAIVNNADRKGGHVLRDPWGVVCGVDHGLTFNTVHKLRTVLWGWAGVRLPEEARSACTRLAADLVEDTSLRRGLCGLLTDAEIERTATRADALAQAGRFPRPRSGRPNIPWPAF